jgi:hypothetical protein
LLVWWLNGPGLRWLAPMVAAHYAAKAGVGVAFEARGTLLGGVEFHGVQVEIAESAVRRVTVRKLVPEYRIPGIFRGEIDAVRAEGVHVEIVSHDREGVGEPLDFAMLHRTLREARARVVTFGFDIRELTVAFPGMRLEATALRHAAGEPEIEIELGAILRGEDEIMRGQTVTVDWADDGLALDRLALHPVLAITDVSLAHPAEGGLSVEAGIDFADAKFQLTVSPELATLALHLREGVVEFERVGEVFGVYPPVGGRVTSLALDVADFFPDPLAATATLGLLVEDAAWEDVAVDELNLDVMLERESLRTVVRAAADEAEVRVDATTRIDRETRVLLDTTGALEIPSLPAAVARFASEWVKGPVPAAGMKADLGIAWADEDFQPASAKVDLRIVPEDVETVGGFEMRAEWEDGGMLEAALEGDGVNAMATLDLTNKRYAGEVRLQEMVSARHAPWLALAGVELPGELSVDGHWSGSGPLAADGHKGRLDLKNAVWRQSGMPDVSGSAQIDYALPARLELKNFKIARDGQVVDGEILLADGLLEIRRLKWTDADGTELADANGRLPVPEQPAEWRAFLTDDARPLDLTVRTRTLGFAKLATWVPALAGVDPAATAALEVVVSGNLAAPVLDATLEVKGVRALDRPAIPPADVALKAAGRDGVLQVEGSLTTPGHDPVVLTAKLPFAPAEWAADPQALADADFEAVARLPRLELARFASLVPWATRIAGVVTGNVRASGKISKPQITGGLALQGGALGLANGRVPEITGVTGEVEFDTEKAVLKSLRATIAGGTLDISGSFAIATRSLDVRARGNALPLVRNEGLIVRANADLRVGGPLDGAAVTGSVTLVDSLIFKDIEILPIGMPFSVPQAAALPKVDVATPTEGIPAPFANWPLDVRITTGDPVLIRGNLATGRILGDLRVGGTLADPRPDGKVRLLRGRAALPFSTLAVPEAVFTFTPANGLDPVIEARGTAEPRPYTVNLFAYGRLSDPQIVLTSTPPLPQNEIMMLLATGTTTRGLENPQLASARAIQLFAEEVRRGRVPLGNTLRPLLGVLDRVDFTLAESDPYSSDTFSTATLKLHDRWYLAAGMGDDGNTRLFAIWRLRFR